MTGHPIGVAVVSPLVEMIKRPLQFGLVDFDAFGAALSVRFLTGSVQNDRGPHPKVRFVITGSSPKNPVLATPLAYSLPLGWGEV